MENNDVPVFIHFTAVKMKLFLVTILLCISIVNAEVYNCDTHCKNCVVTSIAHQCASDYTVINSQLYRNDVCIPNDTAYMLTNCSSQNRYCNNRTLSHCSNGKLKVVDYANDNCIGTTVSTQYYVNDTCVNMRTPFCMQLSIGRDTMIIAMTIFSLFIGLCFSVFSSIPCIVFRGGSKDVEPLSVEVVSEDNVALEVGKLNEINGPGSPSTISEYATSTLRGNSLLTASCLMSVIALTMLHALSQAVNEDTAIKWLRLGCYCLISLVGFFPSSPPNAVRKNTPVLWCSFGNRICNDKIGTSVIQDLVHMVSFFAAIIVFIISEIVEYSTEITIVVYVMAGLMLVLISVQAPISIMNYSTLKCLRCTTLERKRGMLNVFASVSFFIETVIAVLLITYCVYEEALPIAHCTMSDTMLYIALCIIASCCVIGYTAGVVFSMCVLK